MHEPNLAELIVLNEHVAALNAAGIPVDVGLEKQSGYPSQTLGNINSFIAARIADGQSLAQAISNNDRTLPTAYRQKMLFAVRSGSLRDALDQSQFVIESVADTRDALRYAFVYPITLMTLIYLGLVAYCLYGLPVLSSLYESMRLPTSWGLTTLQAIRACMPYWIAIPPLILLSLLVRRVWNWRRQVNWSSPLVRVWAWVPGISHTLFLQRCAYFAQSVATLLNEDTPITESLRLAGGTCGDANLDSASKSLALAIQKGQFPDDDTLTALRFPPFLRWAIWHSNETTDRATGLRLVAGFYQRTAIRDPSRNERVDVAQCLRRVT